MSDQYWYTLGAKATGFDVAGSSAVAWLTVGLNLAAVTLCWSIAAWWVSQAGLARSAASRRAKLTMAGLFFFGSWMGFGCRVWMMLSPAWGPFVAGLVVLVGLLGWMNWQVFAGYLTVRFVSREDLEDKARRIRLVAQASPPEHRRHLEQLARELQDLVRGGSP